MAFALATTLVTLACQGCASTNGADYAYSQPAPEQTLGMTLAVPGSFGGGGALNAPTGSALNGASPMLPSSAAGIRLTAPDSDVTVTATAPPPSAFSLTGSGLSGVPMSDTAFAWNANPLLASVAAEAAASRYGQPDPEFNDVSIGLSIAATSGQTGLAFDVGLAPRVGIREGGDIKSQRLGGELRLGQGLDLLNSGASPDGWYVFVGADGEALVWDADVQRGVNSFTDMQVTDQLTVGDLQAGVSIQRAGGELSLSYIRREIEFNDRNKSMSANEDFAGITFTMRR